MTVLETNPELASKTSIQKFYAGESVLITGGTGFLGKLLIEKLLRSCPDISSIYLIVRPKKGQDAHQRLESILDEPIFSVIKKENPKFCHKITIIAGDCSLPGLGISSTDREVLLREVSIIFNVAATVRFDEKIKQAVAINIQGPMEIMNLARQLKNLKALIHVSTAYSNCNRSTIDEKFYEPPLTGDNAIKLVQSLDDNRLDAITQTLLGDFPNTYAFTKCIAEQVVQQYGRDLPTGIFRPAIVISTFREPVGGWIDNIYGATGAVVGVGAGLIRIMNIDQDCTAELVPADLTINALIATAWDVGNNKNIDAEPPIYNYHATWSNRLTWGQYMDLAMKYGKKVPSVRSIWCYSITATKSIYLFYILMFFLHLLPAALVDTALFLMGKETKMLKLYKKIHKFSAVTTYFSTHKWHFSNVNMSALWDKLSPEDQSIFAFSMRNFDWEAYMEVCVHGLRNFIFKDTPDTMLKAKKRMARLVLLHRFIKYALIALSIWALYLICCFVLSIGNSARYSLFSESIVVR